MASEFETTVLKELAALRSENKSMAKMIRKIRATQEDPTGEKAKNRAKNNGFNIPRKVSPELRSFLKLGDDEMITRSQVNKKISEYVNANNLKHPENGRNIMLNDELRALLQPPEGVQVTYLNVQTYLNKHYISEPKEAAAEGAAAPAEKPPKEPKKPKEPKEEPKADAKPKEKTKRPEVKGKKIEV